jgi:chromosomal replication initiation ATPase DnaA
MTAPRQLTLDLAPRPALGVEDFLVSPANGAALALIEQWPDWPHWAAVVAGPAGSGKSHLGQVWRLRSGAVTVASDALDPDLPQRFQTARALLVENLERGISEEALLFHVLNMAREHGLSVLCTSRLAPGLLDVRLPDLASRLKALPVATIDAPDDALLQAVLVKHFSDRQLTVEPSVVSFLAMHIDRSFAAAAAVVEAIDQRSLADRRRVTRLLAADVIADARSNQRDIDGLKTDED